MCIPLGYEFNIIIASFFDHHPFPLLLCISTSERPAEHPFAGRNQLFCSVRDGKSCVSIRKSTLTSKRHAEHPFTGQNTQHITSQHLPPGWDIHHTILKTMGEEEALYI